MTDCYKCAHDKMIKRLQSEFTDYITTIRRDVAEGRDETLHGADMIEMIEVFQSRLLRDSPVPTKQEDSLDNIADDDVIDDDVVDK